MVRVALIDDDSMQCSGDDSDYQLFKEFCETSHALASASNPVRLAMDCEGVNLSRIGTVEVLSLSFDSQIDNNERKEERTVFLVDLGQGNQEEQLAERVVLVKALMESKEVVKIIHDSRMDCDALHHLHGITPTKFHDTSCYHRVVTGLEEKNLNETLVYYGLPSNAHRDNSVYKTNPRFWASRPMTTRMKDWASSDIDKLHALAQAQLDRASANEASKGADLSEVYAMSARRMSLKRGVLLLGGMSTGAFIGRRGTNIRRLQSRTGTLLYQDHDLGGWMIFYPTDSELNIVLSGMGH